MDPSHHLSSAQNYHFTFHNSSCATQKTHSAQGFTQLPDSSLKPLSNVSNAVRRSLRLSHQPPPNFPELSHNASTATATTLRPNANKAQPQSTHPTSSTVTFAPFPVEIIHPEPSDPPVMTQPPSNPTAPTPQPSDSPSVIPRNPASSLFRHHTATSNQNDSAPHNMSNAHPTVPNILRPSVDIEYTVNFFTTDSSSPFDSVKPFDSENPPVIGMCTVCNCLGPTDIACGTCNRPGILFKSITSALRNSADQTSVLYQPNDIGICLICDDQGQLGLPCMKCIDSTAVYEAVLTSSTTKSRSTFLDNISHLSLAASPSPVPQLPSSLTTTYSLTATTLPVPSRHHVDMISPLASGDATITNGTVPSSDISQQINALQQQNYNLQQQHQ